MQREKGLLDAALEYAKAGMPVVPLHSIRNGRCTCGEDCATPGKHPRTKNGLKDATTDEEQIKKWWASSRWPNASIAGVGGRFLCLDVDSKSGGLDSLEHLIADNAQLPDTAVALTGEYPEGRGRHYWFKLPEGTSLASKVGVRKGIDIRCARGYAVMPPSPHVSGVDYEWVVPFEEIEEAPGWVIDLAPEATTGESTWTPNPNFRMSREVKDFLKGKMDVPLGEQRAFLVRAARSVLTTGKTVDDTADMLYSAIQECDQDEEHPWTYEDVVYLTEDIFRSPPSAGLENEQAGYNWGDYQERNDWGNARRLVGCFPEGHLIHVSEWGKWYIFEDGQWTEDDGTRLRLRWEQETTNMFSEAGQKEKPAEWAMFVKSSRHQARTEAAINLAKNFVRVTPGELNADPFLLNCENGVLDLRTGDLLEPDPKYLLTKKVRASYNKNAKSPLWNRTVKTLLPDRDLRDFMQKVFGYTLTGSTAEHKFFYLHGPPGAGKTTLLEAFAHLMGNYAESAEPTVFLSGSENTGPTAELARLANARLVASHEIEEGARWAEARISHLTGGDKVTARFLHQNPFDFYPKFKLFFTANHKPRVSGSGRSGLWRRIMVIPIERVIPEDERDPALPLRLRTQECREAILAWAVEGCIKWMKDHEAGQLMTVPGIVKDEVETYKTEADHVLQFMSDCVRTYDADALLEWRKKQEQKGATTKGRKADAPRVARSLMYEIYLSWCSENGRRQYLTKTSFNRRLSDMGLTTKVAQTDTGQKGKKRVTECWIEVSLKVPVKT